MDSDSIKMRLQSGLYQHSPSFLNLDKVRMGGERQVRSMRPVTVPRMDEPHTHRSQELAQEMMQHIRPGTWAAGLIRGQKKRAMCLLLFLPFQ